MQGVYVSGNSQGPALVLLHSSMSSARQWRELVDQLDDTFRVINFDLLGYGQAPAPSLPFGLENETQRIEQHLSDLGVRQFHLCAHSFGGAVALKLAHERPNAVLSLSVFEPVAFHLLSRQSAGWYEIQELGLQVDSLDAAQAGACFVNYWNGVGYFESMPMPVQQGFAAQVKKVRMDFSGLTEEAYQLADYAQIQCPVLLLGGKESRTSALEVLDGLAASLPNVQRKWVSGGHMSPISHSKEVNDLLLSFLAVQTA
ncbi:alpha/beta fold hydrolase [Bowmanella pacifica]|uniref:AB hydrolase-1 domain-containing protein n=1 Tax=Bowmanella pacifica TaxID=502051 RepID=A0A918DKL0_9ALTE|nr:alpha/beta hydrolase [Bowmanella pacifica]GGO72315.1 hypothetical protein GCM10010982_30140 [Bowmanella pacifica]